MKKKIVILIIFIVVVFIIFVFNNHNKNIIDVKYNEYLKLNNIYEHNSDYFTQGLFFYNNKLYETTGEYGKSRIIKNIDINNYSAEKITTLDNKYFGEGATIFENKLYVLTWKNKEILVYNIDTLEQEKIINYDKDGWGTYNRWRIFNCK